AKVISPAVAALLAKADEAERTARHRYHELHPDAVNYEYDDSGPDTVREWEETLDAMTVAGQREYEEYAKWLPAEYERQSRRAEHFKRLIAQDRELAEGRVNYPPTEYLVDGWLPTKEIHLLIGESGAGKTTWLFSEFLTKWQREESILGRASHYVPYAVLVNDRSQEGIIRTLERMRLHPGYPIKSINGDPRPLDEKVIEFCDANPHVRFLVIEGIHCGMEDLNDYSAVSKLMASLVKLCRERDLTILGTTHVSKAAASNGVNGRTSAIGSVATAGMSETLLVLTRKDSTVKLTINDHN